MAQLHEDGIQRKDQFAIAIPPLLFLPSMSGKTAPVIERRVYIFNVLIQCKGFFDYG
jgi:hypothetical protein